MEAKTKTKTTTETTTKTSLVPDDDDGFRLVDVCSRPLTPRFSLGRLDDLQLVVDTRTGYFNATKLCRAFDKQLKNWQRKTDTKDFLRALEEGGRVRKPLYRWTAAAAAAAVGDERDSRRSAVRGTYAHPKLLLNLLDHASPAWSVRMNGIVGRHFAGKPADARERNEGERSPDGEGDDRKRSRAPPAEGRRVARRQHLLVVVKKNAPGTHPFYAIRCHRRSKTTQLKKLRRKYPDLAEEFQIGYDANSTNLLERMRDGGLNFTTVYNDLALADDYPIKDFEKDARKIASDGVGPEREHSVTCGR